MGDDGDYYGMEYAPSSYFCLSYLTAFILCVCEKVVFLNNQFMACMIYSLSYLGDRWCIVVYLFSVVGYWRCDFGLLFFRELIAG